MAEAIWVLTKLSRGLYSKHEFTCSNCHKVVSEDSYSFTANGEFAMGEINKELLKEYPYCCKCGCKMNKDPQTRTKMAQNRKSEKEYRKSTGLPISTIKDSWKVKETAVLSDVPF